MSNKSAIGSEFEMSLRILLMLETLYGTALDSITIGAIDFISVYAADFRILEDNLHGYGAYRFSEFPARKGLVSSALRELALSGLVDVSTAPSGIEYCINQAGLEVCQGLTNSYAEEYQAAVDAVTSHYGTTDCKAMIADIHKVTSNSLASYVPQFLNVQRISTGHTSVQELTAEYGMTPSRHDLRFVPNDTASTENVALAENKAPADNTNPADTTNNLDSTAIPDSPRKENPDE